MATVLAIETSCDETSVAVVRDGFEVLSNVVYSQIELHETYGGVVPEVASRNHLKKIGPLVELCLKEAQVGQHDIDFVAATNGPGLIGALLIGVSTAKALAFAWGKPFIGVNHVEGHLFAAQLEASKPEVPFVILLVAGGHTQIVHVKDFGNYEVLGGTIDDAAGEAFDKVARYLDLGYPGGPIIDKLAQTGDRDAVKFPRSLKDGSFDFSFSGLKTSVINYVNKNPDTSTADVAASFQEAVVDVLVDKTMAAAKSVNVSTICMGGGVSANSRLREKMSASCAAGDIECVLPGLEYCTDNAAMIGVAASWRYKKDGPSQLDIGANPSLKLVDIS